MGNEVNLSIGYGFGLNSEATLSLESTVFPGLAGEYKSQEEEVESLFATLGYRLEDFELILGYRKNVLKFSQFEKSDGSVLAGTLSGETKQVMAGIGFLF